MNLKRAALWQRLSDKIASGDVLLYRVTVPEGLTVKEIAKLLDEKGVVSESDFLEQTQNKDLLIELLGPDAKSFEGYLFPETYSYSRSPTSKELIILMVERHKAVYELTWRLKKKYQPHR